MSRVRQKKKTFCIQGILSFLLFLDTFRIQGILLFLLFLDTLCIQGILSFLLFLDTLRFLGLGPAGQRAAWVWLLKNINTVKEKMWPSMVGSLYENLASDGTMVGSLYVRSWHHTAGRAPRF